ncbi:GspH/FimT family pseudopilin [Dyella sp.]|uniref:GspH/FimT family pseudopilin n=1 Tax=Dyella sp. TaxID=1869338 RepID=UPI002FDA6640
MNNTRSHMPGFSLIELMVTLGVMAILLVMASPMITTTLEKNNVSSATNSLLASINYARAEAIGRGTYVSMCPTTDGRTCTTSTDYDTGWLIYAYTSSPVAQAAYDSTKSNNILLRYITARSGVSIQAGNTKILTFGPQGEMKPDNTPSAFDICYQQASSGTAQSTSEVPGVLLTLESSGNAFNQTLAAGAACTGPAPSSSI